RHINPEIMFSENELGRKIIVEIDENKQNITLNSSNKKIVSLVQNTVKWGDLYRRRSSMVFGNLPDLEGNPNITPDDRWTKVNQFFYGKIVTEEVLPKSGTTFLQEIE